MKSKGIIIALVAVAFIGIGIFTFSNKSAAANKENQPEIQDTIGSTDKQPTLNVDRGEAKGEIATSGNIETDILNQATQHVKVVYGNTPADDTVEISDEYKQAIYAAIPILSEYPEAYQERVIQSAAKSCKSDNMGDNLINAIQSMLDQYYQYGYDKTYGPGPESTRPETPEIGEGFDIDTTVDLTQEELENAELPDELREEVNNTPSGPKAINTPTYMYGGKIEYIATGQYQNGKMIYRGPNGDLVIFYEDGSQDYVGMAQDVLDEIDRNSGEGGKMNWAQ